MKEFLFGDKVRHRDGCMNDFGFLDWGVITNIYKDFATVHYWDNEAQSIRLSELVHYSPRRKRKMVDYLRPVSTKDETSVPTQSGLNNSQEGGDSAHNPNEERKLG